MGMDSAPADEDLARVRLIDACENFDECRLAGAVLADEGMNLGGHDRQVDAIQRNRAEEALSEASDLDCGRRVGRHGGSLVWEFRGLAHVADAKFSRNVEWLQVTGSFRMRPYDPRE